MRRWIFSLCLTVLVLFPVRPARAAFDGVVGTGTPGSCTQTAFDSVLNAVQSNGGGTLTFNCGGAASIVFSSPKSITEIVTIDGGNLISLSGGNSTRLFGVTDTGILTLSRIVLSNGTHALEGGAISNLGELTLDQVTIRNSFTSSVGSAGGAIVTYGILVINNSLFENNTAPSGGAIYVPNVNNIVISNSILRNNQATGVFANGDGLGGAILLEGEASLTIHNTRLENNLAKGGGAIHSWTALGFISIDQGSVLNGNIASESHGGAISSRGTLLVERSTLSNNSATAVGGGIFNQTGSLQVSESYFKDNHSNFEGGGIGNLSSTTFVLNNSTFEGNHAAWQGGGLYSSLSTATPTNLTFAGNSAGSVVGSGGGGMMLAASHFTLVNVTFSANTATAEGGALRFDTGTVNLTNVTFHQNSAATGGAIYRAAGILNLKNVLLVQGVQGANCVGNMTSAGFNLSSDGSCSLNQPGDKPNTAALLLPLRYNGGSTRTHLPSASSPAIDAGTPTNAPTVDQRGQPRPFGLAHDIGAVERQAREERFFLPITIR